MCKLPALKFPAYKFRVRKDAGGAISVWDSLRKVWLVLTPEEWVRRHMISYLIENEKVPEMLIKQECPVCVNGLNQRADIVVFDTSGSPKLLCECKAPEVKITQIVLEQAMRYNAVIGAPYVWLSNGTDHRLFKVSEEGYTRINNFSGVLP